MKNYQRKLHVPLGIDAMNGMPDSFRKYKHHWAPNSKMSAVYEHLSQSIIPNIQNETWRILSGAQKNLEDQSTQRANLHLIKVCKRCEYENPRDSKFCNRCAFPLDEREAGEMVYRLEHPKDDMKEKIDRLTNELAKFPEIVDKLLIALAILNGKTQTENKESKRS